MQVEPGDPARFGEGAQGQPLRLVRSIAVQRQRHRPRRRIGERHLQRQAVRIRCRPGDRAGGTVRLFQHHARDAGRRAADQPQRRLAPDDQRGVVRDPPRATSGRHQSERRPLERLETPQAVDRRIRAGSEGAVGLAEDEAAADRIDRQRHLARLSVRALDAQRQVAGIAGREYQRRARDGQQQSGPAGAQRAIHPRRQRRQDRRGNAGQRGDQHRLRLAERGHGVEQQRSARVMLHTERRNELELRRLERAEQAYDVADHADIGAVIAIARLGRRTELQGDVGRRPGQGLRDRAGLRIGEHGGVARLRQAGGARIGLAQQTVGIELHRKAARELRRDVGQLRWIAMGDVGDERLQPRPVEHRLIQLLRCAHERTGSPPDRRRHGIQRAAGIGDQQHDRLLRARGNGRVDRRLLRLPWFGVEQPVLGRRIGRAAQEGEHQPVARTLRTRQIDRDANAVTHRQIGHLRQGERDAAVRDAYRQRRARQIEPRRLRPGVADTHRGERTGGEQDAGPAGEGGSGHGLASYSRGAPRQSPLVAFRHRGPGSDGLCTGTPLWHPSGPE